MSQNEFDKSLLEKFEQEIWSKIPHLEEGKVVNATPLIDLTSDFKECAKNLYKLDISDLDLKIYGKFDANLVSGSIKIRPAIHIMHDAIKTGKLKVIKQ
jgi:Cysteine synthase